MAKAFDTYKDSGMFDQFIKESIPTGHIIVAACKDDCMAKLSLEGRKWFQNLGSKQIWNVQYRCGFVFIGAAGR